MSIHLAIDIDKNHTQIVLPPFHFTCVALTSIDSFEQELQDAIDWDPKVVSTLKALKWKGSIQLITNLHGWEEYKGLVFYKGQVYIPKVPSFHKKILHLCYNSQVADYPRQ